MRRFVVADGRAGDGDDGGRRGERLGVYRRRQKTERSAAGHLGSALRSDPREQQGAKPTTSNTSAAPTAVQVAIWHLGPLSVHDQVVDQLARAARSPTRAASRCGWSSIENVEDFNWGSTFSEGQLRIRALEVSGSGTARTEITVQNSSANDYLEFYSEAEADRLPVLRNLSLRLLGRSAAALPQRLDRSGAEGGRERGPPRDRDARHRRARTGRARLHPERQLVRRHLHDHRRLGRRPDHLPAGAAGNGLQALGRIRRHQRRDRGMAGG